jgi:hypothetical protein
MRLVWGFACEGEFLTQLRKPDQIRTNKRHRRQGFFCSYFSFFINLVTPEGIGPQRAAPGQFIRVQTFLKKGGFSCPLFGPHVDSRDKLGNDK